MRRRSSTAFALALMMLLAPATAWACEWRCAPGAVVADGEPVSAPDAVDSCHRLDEPSDIAVSLSAALHDCGAHQTLTTGPARLSVNRTGDAAPVALLSQPRVADGLAAGAAAPLVARVLAPPGPSSGSMTPLRI